MHFVTLARLRIVFRRFFVIFHSSNCPLRAIRPLFAAFSLYFLLVFPIRRPNIRRCCLFSPPSSREMVSFSLFFKLQLPFKAPLFLRMYTEYAFIHRIIMHTYVLPASMPSSEPHAAHVCPEPHPPPHRCTPSVDRCKIFMTPPAAKSNSALYPRRRAPHNRAAKQLRNTQVLQNKTKRRHSHL